MPCIDSNSLILSVFVFCVNDKTIHQGLAKTPIHKYMVREELTRLLCDSKGLKS